MQNHKREAQERGTRGRHKRQDKIYLYQITYGVANIESKSTHADTFRSRIRPMGTHTGFCTLRIHPITAMTYMLLSPVNLCPTVYKLCI